MTAILLSAVVEKNKNTDGVVVFYGFSGHVDARRACLTVIIMFFWNVFLIDFIFTKKIKK
jgi:hypothetical protein